MRFGFIVMFACVIVSVDPEEASSHTGEAKFDLSKDSCGTKSLYLLFKSTDNNIEFEKLKSFLPSPGTAGYSMAELRDAAKAGGLSLVGIRLRDRLTHLDRPALVRLNRGVHGHFVLIRPVGHTGSLVQVIDAGHSTEVIDFAELQSRPEWTGLALMPSRKIRYMTVVLYFGMSVIFIGLSSKVIRRGIGKLTSSCTFRQIVNVLRPG